MQTNALFKKKDEWAASPERGYPEPRRVLYFLLADTGDDLRVDASDEAWRVAENLRPLQPVALELQVLRVFRESNVTFRAERITPSSKTSA